MKKDSLRKLILFSLFTAIIVIFWLTPIGYIKTPGLSVTTMHIPVIIGACVLGWKYGAGLGFLFGLTSFINHSGFAPNVTSYYFSPLYSGGNFWSLVICFVPRILIGVVAGLVFRAIAKKSFAASGAVAAGVAAVAGSLTNTVLVLSGISIFFGNVNELVNKIITVAISLNGIIEVVAAVVLTIAVIVALRKTKYEA